MKNKNGLTVDMWYKAIFAPRKYSADVWFNDSKANYHGWVYDKKGERIGDYIAEDSQIIMANFKTCLDND